MDALLTTTPNIYQAWAKSITGIDLSKDGGFAIDGPWCKKSVSGNRTYFSGLSDDLLSIIGCTLVPLDGSPVDKQSDHYGPRFAFLVIPHDSTKTSDYHLRGNHQATSADAYLKILSSPTPDVNIIARGDWERNVDPALALTYGSKIQNSFYYLAALICQNLTGRVQAVKLADGSPMPPLAPPLTPRAATYMESAPVPPPPAKLDGSSQGNRKRGRGVKTSDGTRVKPPEGYSFFSLSDGLVLLSDTQFNTTSARPLHHLLDFGALDEATRKLLREQAEILENLAAAYRIGGYNGGNS